MVGALALLLATVSVAAAPFSAPPSVNPARALSCSTLTGFPPPLARLRGGDDLKRFVAESEEGWDADFGVALDPEKLREFKAASQQYRLPPGHRGGPFDTLLGLDRSGHGHASSGDGPIRAGAEESQTELDEAEWETPEDLPDVSKIQPCEGGEGSRADLSGDHWMSPAMTEVAQGPGGERLRKDGVFERDGMLLDGTFYDLCELAAHDLQGKNQRITAKTASKLLKCVRDSSTHLPAEPELNVMRIVLRDYDLAADAKKLVAGHISRCTRVERHVDVCGQGAGGGESARRREEDVAEGGSKRQRHTADSEVQGVEEKKKEGRGEEPVLLAERLVAEAQRSVTRGDQFGAIRALEQMQRLPVAGTSVPAHAVIVLRRLRHCTQPRVQAIARDIFAKWRGDAAGPNRAIQKQVQSEHAGQP